jgi:hypothetical protein
MFEQAIKRFESLDRETERRCLESFLFALTGAVRYLFTKHADSATRLRILIHVSEINRYVLKRVLPPEDSFRTVEYTLHVVEEHVSQVPELEELATGLLDSILKKAGA